jgi:hypothetical protein
MLAFPSGYVATDSVGNKTFPALPHFDHPLCVVLNTYMNV